MLPTLYNFGINNFLVLVAVSWLPSSTCATFSFNLDVNECSDRQVCGPGQICVNNEGSYHCQGEVADQRPDDEYESSTSSGNGHNSHLNCGTGFTYSRHSGQCEGLYV